MRYQEELDSIAENGLFREAKLYSRSGMELTNQKGQTFTDFSSNDYLGLSQHALLKEVAISAINKYGVGSTAARLVSGTTPAHKECESTIAKYKGTEAALFLANGFTTALTVVPSLCGKDDVIIMDKLAHACLIDGARSSGARMRIFPHNNVERLENLLKRERKKLPEQGKILVIVESVYSMDGDLCPLAEIVALKEKYGALLLVDEAHGLGVLGQNGMGLVEQEGLAHAVDIHMGTLGKAAGGAGGYLATTKVLRDLFVNKGRSFIFTTAPPPVQAAVATVAIKLIASSEGVKLRTKLKKNQDLLGDMLGKDIQSAICPIVIGGNEEVLHASEQLKQKGFLVPGIRYPTVAKGTARLRITLSAGHAEEDVTSLASALSKVL